MRIPCPCCGLRPYSEFSYLGDASVARPRLQAEPDAAACAAVYLRPNPQGAHREYWQHVYGCRQWLLVERDTLTHTISGASLVSSMNG